MTGPPSKVGLAEGARGRDVAALKSYLSRYGYLRGDPRRLATEEDPEFDRPTTEALKHYQRFHRLTETGKLDRETADLMSKPRCGCPDVVPPPEIPEGARSVRAYVINNAAGPYDHRNLIYKFYDYVADLSVETQHAAIADAFAKWAAVTDLTFTRTTGNFVDIGFRVDPGDTYLAVAIIFEDRATTIKFYDAHNWQVTPVVANNYDYTRVAMHEIGHALGLDHSQEPAAVMWSGTGDGDQSHALHADDIAGIRALYPVAPTPPPPPPLPPGPPVVPTLSVTSLWRRPQLRVSWPQGQQPAGTHFEVRVASSPGGPFGPPYICGEASTALDYSEDWWTNGPSATRYFKVRAVNAAGVSADSPVMSGTKPAGVPVW